MLEIVYDKDTKEVRAWCADSKEFGNFRPKEGQEVVIWDIPIPSFESQEYKVDVTSRTVIDGNPDYVAPISPRDLATDIDAQQVKIDELIVTLEGMKKK